MPWKIGLIGTGNVASFWAHNLKGIVSAELFVRGSSPEKTGSFVTTHGLIELDAQAVDVFLICVQDRNIASAITALPEHTPAFICAGLFSIHPSHLAAVFINNFGYFLMKHGLSLAQAHNIPSSLFKPLINQTISNLLLDKDLQTGPARRNDIETLRSHESMLSDQSLEIYKALSAFIQHTNSNEL